MIYGLGASLEVMERDARKMRGARPFFFSNLKESRSVAEIAVFIAKLGGLDSGEHGAARAAPSETVRAQ